MSKPRANLNLLLAWQHAKSLTAALKRKRAPWGMLDQFSKQDLVGRYFKDSKFDLRMQTKAEEDPVVAAASVVARASTFVTWVRYPSDLERIWSKELVARRKNRLPKFSSGLVQILFANFAKLHFRTAYEVVSDAGMLDKLPLKPPPAKKEWRK